MTRTAWHEGELVKWADYPNDTEPDWQTGRVLRVLDVSNVGEADHQLVTVRVNDGRATVVDVPADQLYEWNGKYPVERVRHR